jgi:diguanylate cyclase (GGDEF)-like protein
MEVEQEKISLIEKSIAPSIALNISYGFDESVDEIANKALENKNILLIRIQEEEGDVKTFSKRNLSLDDYIKKQEFISKTTLLDPAISKKIAEMTIVYSHSSYNNYMDKLYKWLFWGVLGLFTAAALLIYLLFKALKRIHVLATSLNNFNPANPQRLNLDTSADDEISSIITSANVMVANLVKYLNNSKELNIKLSQNQVHLKDAQRIAKVGSWEYDVTEDKLSLSDEVYRILGMKKSINLSWLEFNSFISKKDEEYINSVFESAIKNGSYFDIKYSIDVTNEKSINIHTRGKVRKNTEGMVKITAVSMDITQDTKNKEMIEKLAYYDALTLLPNRTLLKDRIHKALQSASRQKTKVAILFLDLDHFKLINDTLGHGVGDKLLIYIARQLQKQIRESDTLARIGGDEFVILLPNVHAINDVQKIAGNLLDALHGQHDIDSHNLHITTSIGIAIYPDNSKNLDELITNADTAMYDAKQDGRNKYKIYAKTMGNHISTQMKIEQDLKTAVNNKNELEVYYQPKIDITKNIISGAEALLRWNHPQDGLIYPDNFICVAESTGIILELGRWVIEECVSQIKDWNQAGFAGLRLSINLSGRQFQDNELVPFIYSMIKKYNIDPTQLEFEVTETISMSNMEATLRILNELKSIGVSISIDDFGTGYSSLSYLKKFPINTLKIDRSFVIDMTTNEGDKIIVQTIISMAHSLGFITVAEGVETKEHRDLLRDLGCDQIQGYFYSKAINKDAFINFLLEYDANI